VRVAAWHSAGYWWVRPRKSMGTGGEAKALPTSEGTLDEIPPIGTQFWESQSLPTSEGTLDIALGAVERTPSLNPYRRQRVR
jgi:hypothetical protein